METFLFVFKKKLKQHPTKVVMKHFFKRTFLIRTFLKSIVSFFFFKKIYCFYFKGQQWHVFVLACFFLFLCYRIKWHHIYGYKYTVKEELTCIIDDDNNHSSNAIKILFRNDEKKNNELNITMEQLVGHVPETFFLPERLAKILYPIMKEWRILSMKTINTGEKRRDT